MTSYLKLNRTFIAFCIEIKFKQTVSIIYIEHINERNIKTIVI